MSQLDVIVIYGECPECGNYYVGYRFGFIMDWPTVFCSTKCGTFSADYEEIGIMHNIILIEEEF